MSHSALCKPHKTLLGRFGHWLSGPHTGLRTRSQYDDIFFLWNFGPWEKPDRCWIDVSKQVTLKGRLTFNGPEAQPAEMTPMVRELFAIKGVATVILLSYKIIIDKGNTFSWNELQQPVEDVLCKYLVR